MTVQRSTFFKLVLFVLAGLLPVFSMAANANPEGATDWELFVYGNGHVVRDIFTGIKLLMVPDAGETGFRTLLLVLATIGFLVMAIAAGFDPGKNLMKMFSYVFVVWGVIFASTGMTSNVLIVDLVRQEGAATGEDYRVENAPALVVIPAAFTSSVGKYFTEAMETYYSTPDELKMTGAAAAQFNLFGKMLNESLQYRITSTELKRSLSAYSADCVVNAVALGRLSGPGIDPVTKQPTVLTGVQAITRSTRLVDTLASARNKSILTTYFPYSTADIEWTAIAGAETSIDTSPASLARYAGGGVTVSCDAAWVMLAGDLGKHAIALWEGGSQAWERTGTAVPLETVFTVMLEQTARPGGTTSANYSSPNGFLLQSAMVNTMRGAFRDAAINTGNNEVLQAVSLTQAEAQQKSAWSASFHVFNNMMGYVFTVLQAFIFALTPFIVVALFIPGMGRAIFVNYAQILVWLTLWQPLLSIINFVLVLFGSESITNTVEPFGGLTMSNDGLMSEKTSDLITAAGFLGTMIPLLSWGVVKGAMAFTEFISAGVGSAFASQAGASAATGNLSMGNITAGQTSMNKYSTTMSSAVGQQSVVADMGAQSMTTRQDSGGGGLVQNASSVQLSQQMSSALSSQLSESKAIGTALSQMQTQGWSQSRIESASKGVGVDASIQKAAQLVLSFQESVGTKSGVSRTASDSQTAGYSTQSGESGSASSSSGFGAQLSAGLKAAGTGAAVTGHEKTDNSYDRTSSKNTQEGRTSAEVVSVDKGSVSKGETNSRNQTNSSSSSLNNSNYSRSDTTTSTGVSTQEAISRAASYNQTITEQLTQMQSVTSSFSANQGMSLSEYQGQMAKLNALSGDLQSRIGGVGETQAAMHGHLGSQVAHTEALRDAAAATPGQSGPATGANIPTGDLGFGAAQNAANQSISNMGAAVDGMNAAQKQNHHANQGSNPASTVLNAKGTGLMDTVSPTTGNTPGNKVDALLGR